VAAADRHLHLSEINALKVVRKILVSSADRAHAAPVYSEPKFGLARILRRKHRKKKALFLFVLVASLAVISMFLF
jgi:hypothetical protein